MNNNNAIEISNISKKYVLTSKTEKKVNTVLDNVSIDIKKGTVLGIVGINGCGKSTLMKMIAHILKPDTGEIKTRGTIASILELGMGFHQDMTGRENIYLKSEMYGFSKKEIENKIESIINYSGLKDRIEDPVKTYSSGMLARLAFAIMINVDADILLVDEVLSVGDVTFAEKSLLYFKKLSQTGKTILFTSHSEQAIETMCNRAIILHKGHIICDGHPSEVVKKYRKYLKNDMCVVKELAESGVASAQYSLAKMFREGQCIEKNNDEYINWLKRSADNNYMEALLDYAEEVMETDIKSSIKYYEKAAEMGSTFAQLKLSTFSDTKDISSKSVLEYYENILENGDDRTKLNIARAGLKTINYCGEYKASIDILIDLIKRTNPYALFLLGFAYYEGRGVKKNLNNAIEYFEKSANLGNIESINYLAKIYNNEITVYDPEKSFKWLLLAAKYGHVPSQYEVAIRYREGNGTLKNNEQFEYWYQHFLSAQLAQQLVNEAQNIIATTNDVKLSLIYYELAFKKGSSHAAIQLGKAYREGKYCNKDIQKSIVYYRVAYELDNSLGNEYFDILYESKDSSKYDEMIEILNNMIEKGDGNAMGRMGRLFRYGIGVNKDLKTAKYWYTRASKSDKYWIEESNQF